MVLVAAIATAALAIGLVFWLRHNVNKIDSGPTPPNPWTFAKSLPIRNSDSADREWIGREFTRLTREAPWLNASARSVFDTCSVEEAPGSLFGGGSQGYLIQCDRTDTGYYAYGGSTAAGVRQLKRALHRMGWGTFSLEAAAPGSPALPVADAGPSAAAPPAGKASLEISWAKHGSQLDLERDVGAVPPLVARHSNAYIQVLRPSLGSILSHLDQAHPHVLIVALDATYAELHR